MMKIEMLKAMRGRDHTPASVPTGGAAAGITPLKRSIEGVRETFSAMKEIGEVMRQFNPQPDGFMQLANTQLGASLGLVIGKLVEGGMSAYQRRQELMFEREKLKAKGDSKPAASPGGFDLFGDMGGGSQAPAPTSPQVVLGAGERAVVDEMEKRMANLLKVVESQSLQIQSLAEQVRKTLPMSKWRFECKAEGCGHTELIAARDEAESAAAFKTHLTSAHPHFREEAQRVIGAGATTESVRAFELRWVSYRKEE